MSDFKKYAVIVAGGKGTRMGSSIPKQFLPLLSLPVLCHSVLAFAHTIRDIKIILVAPEDQMDSARTILKSYTGQVDLTIVAGGETRFHSVQNGLKHIKEEGIVFIHDAVRPLISGELIARCFEHTMLHGSAIPSIPVSDSMRIIDDNGISHSVNRDKVRIIQTPQTFLTSIIVPAFNIPYDPAFTDEATVAEASGVTVHLVEGDKDNIKITTPGDMIIADTLLKASE
jgi:2-C-methyl-D-erythritol 4-phosphate cytidylyltransferase